MLGMNEIHYRKTSDMVAEYKGIIQALKQGSPGTDIVLCAVSHMHQLNYTSIIRRFLI